MDPSALSAKYKEKLSYIDKHKYGRAIITASPVLQLLEEGKNQEASTFFCTTIPLMNQSADSKT